MSFGTCNLKLDSRDTLLRIFPRMHACTYTVEYSVANDIDSTWDSYALFDSYDGGGPPPPIPEFPIGLAMEILLIPVIIYILWRSKQRKKLLVP